MMKISKISKLIVKYKGKVVGYLVELKNGDIAFQYEDNWLKDGFSISPLSLPLSNEIFIPKKKTLDGLFGVFNDSLPDGWGELLVRRKLNSHGINYDKLTPLQKLSIINHNSLGALEYEPNIIFKKKNIKYDLDVLAKEIEKIYDDNANDNNLDEIFNLGGSSAGARPKAYIEYDNEEWIVKFPCSFDPKDIGKKEYLANSIARECKIDVNEYKLFDSNICSGYFAAKRFDRSSGEKIHMISLAAILETSHRIPNLDYGHLFQVVSKISANKEKDLYEVFKRMCFNVFYKNRDDHSRNFSFLYDEKLKGYILSPFYDITSLSKKPEHEMTVNDNGLPTENDILELAQYFKLSKSKCIKIMNDIKQIINKNIGI